jgi:predicted nucleic acid-binding protein
LTVYLDTSVLAAVFFDDAHSPRAGRFMASAGADLMVSDYAAAEFAAVVGRQVRMRRLTADEARVGFADFDVWMARTTQRLAVVSGDVRAAEAILRRLDLNVRAPDALHLVIVQRSGGTLATFDKGMAASAEVLGIPVATA